METYSTIQCTMKVTDRVWTSQQTDADDIPFKYIVKDSNGKLLGYLLFTNKDQEGITNDDLLAIIKDRQLLQSKAIPGKQ